MHKHWQVIVLKGAKRYLQRLTANECGRVLDALYNLQRNPSQAKIKPLVGRPEWSMRVGALGILLRFDEEKGTIVVTRIGPRGDVYK